MGTRDIQSEGSVIGELSLSGTTALTIGTCTTAINVAANTVIPNLINIGTSTNPLHWDGVASNILVYQENTDTTPASVTANKFVLHAAHSAAVTSGRLECFRAVVTSYSTNNVTASMRSLVGQTEFAGNCTYVGSDPQGCYGVIASIWSGSNLTAIGDIHPLGIFFGVETGSALNGESSYIYIYNYGKVNPTSVMQIYDATNVSGTTYFLDMQNTALGSAAAKPCYTGDVNPTGTTGDNALGADGHIKILVGSTPYYIPIFGTLVT
jgi:hypothetical protein